MKKIQSKILLLLFLALILLGVSWTTIQRHILGYAIYKNSGLGFEFSYPKYLDTQGSFMFNKNIAPKGLGTKGAEFCLNFIIKMKPPSPCGENTEVISLQGQTKDYLGVGRGAMFGDFEGYKIVGGKVFMRWSYYLFNPWIEEKIKDEGWGFTRRPFIDKIYTNKNGVEIVRLREGGGFENPFAPGKDHIGAFINLKGSDFLGIAINFNLKNNLLLSKSEFDNLLDSIKVFTPKQ